MTTTYEDSVKAAIAPLENRRDELTTELARIDAALRALRPLVTWGGPREPVSHPNCRCALPLAVDDDPEPAHLPPVLAEPLDPEPDPDIDPEDADALMELLGDSEHTDPLEGARDFIHVMRNQPQSIRRRADSKAFDQSVIHQLTIRPGRVATFRELVKSVAKKTVDRTSQAHESDVRNSLQRMKASGIVGRTGQTWSLIDTGVEGAE